MKKRILSLIMAGAMMLCVAFTGCGKDESKETEKDKVDYSKYSFAGVRWSREAEHDVETIRFNTDGSFSYSCACGNPVNDSDLCESYTYDDETKTITLDCIEETEDMVTKIIVNKCDGNTIELDFDGDIRTFTKEN